MNVSLVLERPEWAPMLVAALLAVWVLFGAARHRALRLRRAVGARGAELVRGEPARRVVTRRLLFGLAAGLAAFAAMGPAFGTARAITERRGADVIVALDVSRSMLARDLAPDRLGRARKEIEELTRTLRDGRVGLVVFAGEARLLVPPTRDLDVVREIAAGVGPEVVSRGGTDLDGALEVACEALRGDDEAASVVLLLTDGEELGASGRGAAEACARRGVVVHAVGLGTTRGAAIPLAADRVVRDSDGRAVNTALDADALRALCARTGGEALLAVEAPRAAARLVETRIRPLARLRAAPPASARTPDRYAVPLLLALLLWLVEWSMGRRAGRRTGEAAPRAALVGLLLFVLPACDPTSTGREAWASGSRRGAYAAFSEAVARAGPRASPELRYDLALAATALGKHDEADAVLRHMPDVPDPDLAARAAFLRGNVSFARSRAAAARAREGSDDLRAWMPALRHAEDALAAWQAAAASRWDWPEARRNVERGLLWLETIREQRSPGAPPPPRPGPGSGDAEPARPEPKTPPPPTPPPDPGAGGPPAEAEVVTGALPAGRVLEVLRVVERKLVERQDVRRAVRDRESATVEKDW